MFRRPICCPRDGICLEHLCLVSLVIVQNSICSLGQMFAILDIRIRVHRHHVGPLIQVFLLFGCELVLIVLRPTMKITSAIENKYRLCRRSSGARLLCLKCAAGDNQQQKDRKSNEFSFSYVKTTSPFSASLRLTGYPMCLRPLPKLHKLRRRSLSSLELFPMLDQHFRERHSISGDSVRIRAAFEQMQRICVLAAVMKPILGGVKQ